MNWYKELEDYGEPIIRSQFAKQKCDCDEGWFGKISCEYCGYQYCEECCIIDGAITGDLLCPECYEERVFEITEMVEERLKFTLPQQLLHYLVKWTFELAKSNLSNEEIFEEALTKLPVGSTEWKGRDVNY